MTQHIIGSIFLFITSIAISQGLSTEGYIVKKDGTKLEGYIQRMSISENPMYVGFAKEKKATNFEKIAVSEIELVSTGKRHMYRIAEVSIDNTSNDLGKLEEANRNERFEMTKKTVFLEIIVKGQASLYRTYLDAREKFFYKPNPEAEIEQLLFKKYFIPRDANFLGSEYVRENREYLKQLSVSLPCFNKKRRMLYPDYTLLSLKSHFKKYNKNKCYN